MQEETILKRVAPNSLEAEQSVVGAMLLDREAIHVASEIITADDFYIYLKVFCAYRFEDW